MPNRFQGSKTDVVKDLAGSAVPDRKSSIDADGNKKIAVADKSKFLPALRLAQRMREAGISARPGIPQAQLLTQIARDDESSGARMGQIDACGVRFGCRFFGERFGVEEAYGRPKTNNRLSIRSECQCFSVFVRAQARSLPLGKSTRNRKDELATTSARESVVNSNP